jgi:hypothetical protein
MRAAAFTSNGAWHRGQSSSITIPFNVYLHLFYHAGLMRAA